MTTRKILVVAANPRVHTNLPLRLEEEAKKIRLALRSSERRDEFPAEYRGAVTANDLRKALSEEKPAIVHFSGHGTTAGKLVLETDTGNPNPVDTDALADLFAFFSKSLQCVVLNACYSDNQAKAINKHVPHVIGMTSSIGDNAAIRFSEAFYNSLGNGHTYEESHELAKQQLVLEGMDTKLNSQFHSLRKSQITSPKDGDTINANSNDIYGLVGTGFTGRLYLLTGGNNHTYWPSSELNYHASGAWKGAVHVGSHSPQATIRLVSVDQTTADYIEFYRKFAPQLRHPGMTLAREPELLDKIIVKINLMPLRDRLVGSYTLIDRADIVTGEIVEIALSGEWGVQLKCSLKGEILWESTIMMDGGNPNVGRGVYVYTKQGHTGHHHIIFNPGDQTIRVDGYNLQEDRRWVTSYLLKRLAPRL